jgi:5-methylcytosine-specific restriction endonuclease McrA
MVKQCVICSAEFETIYSKAKFCSPKCRNKQQTMRKQREKDANYKQETKQCPVCDDFFLEKKFAKGRQVYCSKTCKFVVVRRSAIERGVFYESINRIKENNKEKYKELEKEYTDKKRFGGNKKHVLERDGYKCTECGKTSGLIIHHIDHSGKSENPNNEIDNLITLCKSCHGRHHASKHKKYEHVELSKEDILKTRAESTSWNETARKLGVHKDNLRKRRKQFGIY